MKLACRLLAIGIAIAGLIDPAVTRRSGAPLSVAFAMPKASHPDFQPAHTLRADIVSALGDRPSVDGVAPTHAVVAIGDAELRTAPSAPVFAVPVQGKRSLATILEIRTPRHTVPGQAVDITARIRGRGLAGRNTSLSLELRGLGIGAADHTWTRDDEAYEAHYAFASPSAGVHRVRLVGQTQGVDERVVADTVVIARDQPLRVLAFEPRPSWPLTFVRRTLEADSLFQVAFTSRSSRPAVTSSGGAPRSLQSLELDRFDAVLVGALDDLADTDVRALDSFVSERGGTLVLLPDRRIPEGIRTRFNLPRSEEVLLDVPLRIQSAIASPRASELLVMPATVRALAAFRHGKSDRTVIGVVDHGAGRVVVSGALDAWRYRADQSGAFDELWRGIVADGALEAPPRIEVTLVPRIARPGDRVQVSVSLRGTEFERIAAQRVDLPAIAASLKSTEGQDEMIRLWPAPRPGVYRAAFVAPAQGQYNVSVSTADASTSVPLPVADDVVHPAEDVAPALSHAAEASGGAVVQDVSALAAALAAIDTGSREKATRPMRSAWWIAPFSLLLCAEWALRRRSGLR